MDFNRRLAANLSAALLAAPFEPRAIAAALRRCFDVARKALAQRLLEALVRTRVTNGPPPSPQGLTQFLLEQREFEKLAAPLREKGEPPRMELRPALFSPSARFGELAVPQLATPGDLAAWLGLAVDELDWFADMRRTHHKTQSAKLRHYHYRFVAKSSGPPRLLEAPKERMKAVQRKILREILDAVAVHPAAYGFVAGRNCIEGASLHAGERVVVALDLKDFFLEAPLPRVHATFRHLGYPQAVATLLTRLCATSTPSCLFEGMGHDFETRKRFASPHLPQGAPTSPSLANLVAFRLDTRLAGLARRFDANYTRYADDLAFSGDDGLLRRARGFVAAAAEIVADEGFALNPRKTRIMTSGGRQRVTGVVVNEHVNVQREDYDRLKAILHNCARNGFKAENRDDAPYFRARLAGKVSWVEQVDPKRGGRLRALLEKLPEDAERGEDAETRKI